MNRRTIENSPKSASSLSAELLTFGSLSRREKVRLLKILWYIFYFDKQLYAQIAKTVLAQAQNALLKNLGFKDLAASPLNAFFEQSFPSKNSQFSVKKAPISNVKPSVFRLADPLCPLPPVRASPLVIQTHMAKNEPAAVGTSQFLWGGNHHSGVVSTEGLPPIRRIGNSGIWKNDLDSLRQHRKLTSKFFDFFCEHINKRQGEMSPELLLRRGARAHLFLTSQTSPYLLGKSEFGPRFGLQKLRLALRLERERLAEILLSFDCFCLPFGGEREGFALALFEPRRKTFAVFHPVPREFASKRYEVFERDAAGLAGDLALLALTHSQTPHWTLQSVETPSLEHWGQSGLVCAHFLHQKVKGVSEVTFGQAEIEDLRGKLVKLGGGEM